MITRSGICGHSSLVEYQLPKLRRRVRFPLSAPFFTYDVEDHKKIYNLSKTTCKTLRFMVNYNGAWRIDRVAKEPHWKCGKV